MDETYPNLQTDEMPLSKGRRVAIAALAGGAFLVGTAGPGAAQTSSSVDTVPLQFALNLQYLTTNYLQVVTYGKDRQLPAQHIYGGDTSQPGVSVTTVLQIRYSRDTRGIQARVREIADEHWFRTLMLRAILRAETPAQKLIDYSPETFTTLFRLAGAIAPDATFDPYESPVNALLAAETLLNVQASVYSTLLARMTNEITLPMMASLAAGAAGNAATIRSMLYDAAAARPEVLTMVDQLSAWRDRVDGSSIGDRGLSPSVSAGQSSTRLALVDADGLHIGRTPEQALNVLFMTSASVAQGGFFPTGINGTIARSAAN